MTVQSDSNSTATDATPLPRIPHDHSFYAQKFNITSFEHDPTQWNRDWEKVLRTLSSADVYAAMAKKLSMIETDANSELHQLFREGVLHQQCGLTMLWDKILGKQFEAFRMAWILLNEKERTRYLMKGLEIATDRTAFGQDSRALCPEITVSAMAKQKGVPFTDFLNTYQEKLREVPVGHPYLPANEWWDKAPQDVPQSLSGTFPTSAFESLTTVRNHFIALFVVHTTMSVVKDLNDGSPVMDPVKELVNSHQSAASSWTKTLAGMRDKPVIRCENCTKSPEEIQSTGKFMVCSGCRSKLGFMIHYCSQACQKEDWRNHKKHCGKKKVSKKLPGTVHDPFWAYSDVPDHVRDSSFVSKDGGIDLTSVGFPGPNNTRQYTPALEKQISILTADRMADYYLFDEADRPVRVVHFDMWTKMQFRCMRLGAWSDDSDSSFYMAGLAQYLVKHWGSRPGLSRERILRQFDREYGDGATAKVEDFERRCLERGEGDETHLDMLTRGMRRMPLP